MISRRCKDRTLKHWTDQPIVVDGDTQELCRDEIEAAINPTRRKMLDKLNADGYSPLWDEFDDEQLAWLIGGAEV
jgi:hypothetical protein